jgi:hypothetical protein
VRDTKTVRSPIQVFAKAFDAPVCSVRVTLADGSSTTVHSVRQLRSAVQPKLIVFPSHTGLLEWSLDNNISTVIGGGFDLHHTIDLLGDYWVDGVQLRHVPVDAPWNKIRGAIHFDTIGNISIGKRSALPLKPDGDLLQTGPVLVLHGRNVLTEGISPEGFSLTAHQFTPDPSVGRHPRSAIGYDDRFIWTVVCDGRVDGEAGLTLFELAEFMRIQGADFALNLDGGSSTQLIRRGRLLNKPWGQQGDFYPEGLPTRSAIYFLPR